MRYYLKKAALYTGIGVGGYAVDRYLCYSTVQRNLYTAYTAVAIFVDVKMNFVREKGDQIEALHGRVSKRILDVCKSNAGLYIKFAQQMATVPVLPAAYIENLKQLYDQAPVVDYETVCEIFQQEFNLSPDDIFKSFDHEPIQSASIAQVHKAVLNDGRVVAVKVQKPNIAFQIGADMLAYRVLIYLFEIAFDLPLYWSADYIEKHLREETDFLNEVRNAEKCRAHIVESNLKDLVHIPVVFHELSSKRVMVAEWIEGVSLASPEAIVALGFSTREVMSTIVNVFSDQLFRSGFVHADPHQGNIIIRKHPTKSGPQVVLLDHGLYVQCTDKFVHEYAEFWQSLFSLDKETTFRVAREWGIQDPALFATATLARPWIAGKAVHTSRKVSIKDAYDSHMEAKRRIAEFLADADKLPKELIFVGRNLNCVRADNKCLGSPVNRINLMAYSAASALRDHQYKGSSNIRLYDLFYSNIQLLAFHSTLFAISFVYMVTDLNHRLKIWFGGNLSGGFEAVLESKLQKKLSETLPGVKFQDAFE